MQRLFGEDFFLTTPLVGMTIEHFQSVWIEQEFYRQFLNSLIVTTGVVSISLTVGTLAGYGLARSGSNWAFWILMAALVFKALPHSVLVSGYLPWFINSAEWLKPIFGEAAPTLYGQPWASLWYRINQSAFHDLDAPIILSKYPPRIMRLPELMVVHMEKHLYE